MATKLSSSSVKETILVHKITLEDDGSPSKAKQYLRLPPPVKPYILRISLDAGTSASQGGCLYTNFPEEGKDFDRSIYYKTELPQNFSKPFEIDLLIKKSGAFEYYLEHSLYLSSDLTSPSRIRSSPGYFAVEPLLSIPARTPILSPNGTIQAPGIGGKVQKDLVNLPLDGLVIQTVIAKWMGSFEEWKPHLDLMSARGYNMIHYTPLQQRGDSGSPYSIFDQLEFSDDLFEKGTKKSEKVGILKEWLGRIKNEWGMLGMIDVVLNHTANNSEWLEDHPEAGYNVINSPHLEAALELDTALLNFSSSLASLGLPTELVTAKDLESIMTVLKNDILPPLKLYEFYAINVEEEAAKFSKTWSNVASTSNGTISSSIPPLEIKVDLKTLSDKELAEDFAQLCLPKHWQDLGGRYHVKANMQGSVSFISTLFGLAPSKESAVEATTAFKKMLDIVNVDRYKLYDEDLKAIIDNTNNRIRYTRLDPDGPKLGPITPKSTLVEPLFTRLPANFRTKNHDPRSPALANNGWIWDADPLQDFASSSSRTYIRRDLIVWGDCVKLRYGTSPESNPWLWSHMTSYVELLAELFDGFRLDNSHSTPIHVGEYLLDKARKVRGNLYVCAELFTGSQDLDLHFVCKLGLNSLIREAMNSSNPKEQSGLLYQYGLGKPIGSMDTDCLSEVSTVSIKNVSYPCKIVPLPGSVPHAFLMDVTHDNESPLHKRTAEDALPTGSLVTFSRSAIGSNRGFDDLYPKILDVVTEERKYEVPKDVESGVGGMKRLLNHLHTEMVLDECIEGHFSEEGEYITSHRVNPITHRGYFIIAHTAFVKGTARGDFNPIRLDGTIITFVAGTTIKINSEASRDTSDTLRGLDVDLISIAPVIAPVKEDSKGRYSEIIVPAIFPPGSVLVFSTMMDELSPNLYELCATGAKEAFARLDLVELNILMYRADGEERDAVGGDGTYAVPGVGSLVYCGLQGWMSLLKPIMARNDLGHSLCEHLRAGPWTMDYITSRLQKQIDKFPRLRAPKDWFSERFDLIKKTVPAFLRPKYFAMVVNVAFKAARDRVVEQYSPLIKNGPEFTVNLALTAVQMYGQVRSASLDSKKETPSLAAGLPHFTAGWARTWGRDVFISLRGLFLVTGQFSAARDHILAFASVLKHGLIPNLLDSGRTPRYNSRDSPWFMLQNIQDYVNMAPNGLNILNDTVKRRFPLSDKWVPFDSPEAYAISTSISDIIQEILQRHASGIFFREYNAGPNLDGQMSDEGFNIEIHVDWKTGLIFGGNQSNCGTWMDKMGESAKAGNKGLPGTPRDGAPIEITGLLKSAVRWLAELSSTGKFPYSGVNATIDGVERKVSYSEWNDLIQVSFEKSYFIPTDSSKDSEYLIDPSIVARRGIYKDVLGSGVGRERADYQLRCNFPVAMTVAPELFDPINALGALKIYQEKLVGPLGVKTLDPDDRDYRGYYDNSNDSDDRSIAKGWNYHQGPEWVWPIGYFLRAYLIFDVKAGAGKTDVQLTYHHIHQNLAVHRYHIANDAWAGLPELTNENGRECSDSCYTQAWSSSTILDVLDEMNA